MTASKKKLRIIYLVPTPLESVGGGTRVITHHINGLLGLGHKVEIWVPRGYGSEPYFHTAAPLEEFDTPVLLSKLNEPDILVMTDLDKEDPEDKVRTDILRDSKWGGQNTLSP